MQSCFLRLLAYTRPAAVSSSLDSISTGVLASPPVNRNLYAECGQRALRFAEFELLQCGQDVLVPFFLRDVQEEGNVGNYALARIGFEVRREKVLHVDLALVLLSHGKAVLDPVQSGNRSIASAHNSDTATGALLDTRR